VWLSRPLANGGHYPAVAVLESISRVMVDVVDEGHLEAARSVRRVLSTWADIEDLVNIGAYAAGNNLEFDVAVAMRPVIAEFLRQGMRERSDASETRRRLLELHGRIAEARERLRGRSSGAVREEGKAA